MTPEQKSRQLGLQLPPPFKPTGRFRPTVTVGSQLYVAGHGPLLPDGQLIIGRVGADLDLPQARAAARQTALSILATLRAALGSLDRIARVVKTLGMVNSTPDFDAHPAVIDGCSDLFAELLGDEHGVGARSAVGMSSLPFGMAVEVEMILELHPVAGPSSS